MAAAVVAAVAATVVVVLGAAGVWGGANPDGMDAAGLPTARVQRGHMSVTIKASGEIVAEKQRVINNDLRWPAIIEEVVPSGQRVNKDDVLIRFRCDQLIDAIKEHEILAQAAKDQHKAAVTTRELKKMEMDSRVRKAKQALTDAQADQTKYQKAEWPQQRDEATAAIQLAQRDLILAEDKLASKLKINEDPELNRPYSQNEIEAEKLTVERLKIALRRAETQEKILKDYTHPRALRNKKIAVKDAELDLLAANAEHEKQLNLAGSAADLAAHKSRQQQEKLDGYIEDRDERLTIVAKEPGLVVHQARRRRWEPDIALDVNVQIDPNQQLMIIPELGTLVMRTEVPETIHQQVVRGLPARIALDAHKGKEGGFAGTVSSRGQMPESDAWWSPGVKVYRTMVSFDQDVTRLGLRPGFTGDVEIALAELGNVLSVPIAAVFSEGESTFCYRVSGGRAERVKIEVGLSNSKRVQITSGLNVSDEVLLVLPPGHQPREATEEDREKPRRPAQPEMEGKPGQKASPTGTTRPAKPPTPPAGGHPAGRGSGRRPHP